MLKMSHFNILRLLRSLPRRRIAGLWLVWFLFLAACAIVDRSITFDALPKFLLVFLVITVLIFLPQKLIWTDEFLFKINREAGNLVEIHVVKRCGVKGGTRLARKLKSQSKVILEDAATFAIYTRAKKIRIDSPLMVDKNIDLYAINLIPAAAISYEKIPAHNLDWLTAIFAYLEIQTLETKKARTWRETFSYVACMQSEGWTYIL